MATFQKYLSLELHGDLNYEDILKESEKIIENTIKGKKEVRLRMKMSIPEPYMMLYEVMDVIEIHEKEKDDRL